MNIIERGQAFVQSLRALAGRTGWEWKRCPACGSPLTIKNGSYKRHPWFLGRRESVRVQRHLCQQCHRTYSEQSAWLVGGSWFAREVHRAAVDHWQHVGSSLRRTAELLRSWLGRQERFLLWCPLAEAPPATQECHLYNTFANQGEAKVGCLRAYPNNPDARKAIKAQAKCRQAA